MIIFSKDFINEVKTSNPILEIAKKYFPNIVKVNDIIYRTNCRHEGDHTPSLTFFVDTNTFHCFGCGAGVKDGDAGKGSDVIAFVQWLEECTWQEAIKILADNAKIELPQETVDPRIKTEKERIRKKANVLYYNLQGEVEALEYLYSRNLDDELILHWRIGCTTEEPKMIMVPIMDISGDIVAFSERFLRDSDRKPNEPKYNNDKNTFVFNKGSILYGMNYAIPLIRKHKFAVVVEGYFDVIALQAVGVPAVGSMGAGITVKQGDILRNFTDTVVLFFDGDDAGLMATERSAERIKDLRIKIVNVHKTDPDDIAKIYGDRTLEYIKETAVTINQFRLNKCIDKYNSSLGDISKQLIESAGKTINAISDPTERFGCINQLNKLLGMDCTNLLNQLRRG